MNEVHSGKIGHLPKALQEQVNRRLEQGENGRTVVAWLNALPEVQAVLAAEMQESKRAAGWPAMPMPGRYTSDALG